MSCFIAKHVYNHRGVYNSETGFRKYSTFLRAGMYYYYYYYYYILSSIFVYNLWKLWLSVPGVDYTI